MAGIKAIGLLTAILAACPGVALAQNASESERAAARLKEADRLEQQGLKAAGAGNHASAVIPFEAVLMIREQTLGPDHPDTVRSLDNLAMIDLALGQPAEAEALLKRALASREKALGADHPDVADSLHSLAYAYAASGDVEQSLPLFERAAAIRTRALGPDHPRVAEIIHSMAAVDLVLARRAGSWRMPDLLTGMRRGSAALARPRLSREEYLDRAERGFGRALAIRERALGPDHPAVAASLRSLAHVLAERGRFAEAEPLMKRSLAITEKTLGPAHPATASLLDHYADILANARKGAAADAEVKALKTRARAIRDAQVRPASADAPPSIAPAR